MKNSKILEEWATLIGQFFVSFAKIEHTTCISIQYFSEDNISNTANRLAFKTRVELLIELITDKKYIDDDKTKKYTDLLEKALKLSEKRNIIAHNPILLDLYTHEETEQLIQREVIISKRNKRIFLDNLKEMVDEAEKLSKELSDAYIEILPCVHEYNHAIMWKKFEILKS
jgi:hypothetical protein